MGRAIRAHQPGTVNRKAHRQVLDSHIVHHLVIGALKEGGINGRERTHALRGKASGKGHPMLFRDANIERAIRMRLGKTVNARARRHRGGDGANARIGLSQLGERIAKDVLIGRRTSGALGLFARHNIELGNAVIFVRAVLRRSVAFALFGHDVDQHRSFRCVAHIFEDRDQMIEIVPVNGPHIIEAELFKQSPTGNHAA